MPEFEQLSEMEKLSLIMESGILMCQHSGQGSRIFIYRFDTFFVSATYTVNDNDRLTDIHCFEQASFVEGYRRQQIAVNPAEREYEMPRT